MADPSPIQRTWSRLTVDEFFEIASLRTTVFFLEQRIDEEELDSRDREESTQHLWIPDAQGVAAYLRVVENASPARGDRDARRLIGRVVTRPDRRGEGLARILIAVVIERFGHEPLALHSQSYIQPLYEGFDFEPYGEEYIEAGLPHRAMYRAARP